MECTIRGIGTALPEHTMSMDEAIQLSTDIVCRDEREARLVRTMFRRAGVQKRHTCVPYTTAYEWAGPDAEPSSQPGKTTAERMQVYAEHAGPLAKQAADNALACAGVGPGEITHLITISCTGFEAPGVDIELIEEMPLRRSTERLHIGYMGCHGAINGMRAARGLALSDRSAKILMCAVELCGLHYKFQWDPELILANALFADGAAALVLEHDSPTSAPLCRVTATGSYLVPDSKETITWRVGNHGFEMAIASKVPDLIRDNLGLWLSEWLGSYGRSIESIGSWAVHPGGPRILQAVEDALALEPAALATSHEVLSECGNMSAPTVLFVLRRLLQRDAPRPCVMLGFGPGLMAEVALID
ncbi:MAG: chalcone synthase [Planctomycetaceae bacterium]|nr:chalcone synthase [Planctomycetaceae bacterium]